MHPWHDETWRQRDRPGMKRTAEDRKFSKEIRTRDGYTCQRCGNQYPESSKGLHCAHMFSRGKLSTRFDPANARALCYGCHRYLDTHPDEKREFFKEWLGDEAFEALELRSNVPYKSPAPKRVAAVKECTKCQQILPVSEFHLIRRNSGTQKPRLASRCKACANEDSKQRRVKDPDVALRASCAKYGISIDDYRELLDVQEGVCAICKEPPSGGRNNKRLHIDHDPKTGEVRGLLCSSCNTAIGLMKDDILRFHWATEYIIDAQASWDEEEAS